MNFYTNSRKEEKKSSRDHDAEESKHRSLSSSRDHDAEESKHRSLSSRRDKTPKQPRKEQRYSDLKDRNSTLTLRDSSSNRDYSRDSKDIQIEPGFSAGHVTWDGRERGEGEEGGVGVEVEVEVEGTFTTGLLNWTEVTRMWEMLMRNSVQIKWKNTHLSHINREKKVRHVLTRMEGRSFLNFNYLFIIL